MKGRDDLIYSISKVVMAGRPAKYGDWLFTFSWVDGYTATKITLSYTDEDSLAGLVDLMIETGALCPPRNR